jgi:hypothetical protein
MVKKKEEPVLPEKLDDLDAEFNNHENSDDVEDEIPEVDIFEEFELEALILEGKDALIDRSIVFFSVEDQRKKKMPITISPISKKVRGQIVRKVQSKNNRSTVEELTLLECLYKNDKPMKDVKVTLKDGKTLEGIELIRAMPDGVVDSIYEEVKQISSLFTDRFEDKAIDKVFGRG